MRIVVIGGSGLIGTRLVALLAGRGHEVVAASPSTGVDTLTGAGLDTALAGADVVVDVSNSPSFEATAARGFFETSGRNLTTAELAAGVRHHVLLSVVGVDRLGDNGYFRAKVRQEELVAASGIPYTVVRATQFFEFLSTIVDAATDGDTVRLPAALIQPLAADDVAAELAAVAVGTPAEHTVEVGGPERFRLDDLGRTLLARNGDHRTVTTDPGARYFGAVLAERSLVPADDARTGSTTLDGWAGAQTPDGRGGDAGTGPRLGACSVTR
ncbi:SDR family oxidoreductase [Micromonospora cathayae]|uniref:SDR family oxidoreductase n=1 Tax=Micromonospora cathayae TaxID=3028804 RepID=A0ABY7ZIU7_9ACTN|nr:SDR family oxidoreductase [Micromonospora sp. HUAS 3]WDZ82443.1 SDR family oxidoreductase [Micromonospora sp. HUAS 3]